MENFFNILDVVAPVFLLMIFGYLARRMGIIGQDFVEGASRLVFRLLLPINVFNNIYSSNGLEGLDMGLIFLAFGFLTLIVLGFNLIFSRLGYEGEERGVVLQVLVRSNIVLFGLAIARNYFEPGDLSLVTLYISLISIIANSYSVLIYEIVLRKNRSIRILPLLKSVLKNPILIGTFLGLAALLSGIRIYNPMEKSIRDIASMATPLGLLCIGASIEFGRKLKDQKLIRQTLVVKALVLPSLGLLISYLLGLRGLEIFVIMIVLASPAAVSTHAMALIYTDRADLAAELIFLTSIFNSISVFLAIWIMSSLAII